MWPWSPFGNIVFYLRSGQKDGAKTWSELLKPLAKPK
jgi:hypothetical protein